MMTTTTNVQRDHQECCRNIQNTSLVVSINHMFAKDQYTSGKHCGTGKVNDIAWHVAFSSWQLQTTFQLLGTNSIYPISSIQAVAYLVEIEAFIVLLSYAS